MNNIHQTFDPYEDPETDRNYTNDYPLRRDRIKSILAQILNHRTFQTPREIKLLQPPCKRERPGLTFIKDGPGDSDSRRVWLDSQILFQPVFKYAIFKHCTDWNRPKPRWSPFERDNTGWHDLYPGVRRVGGIGLFNNNEYTDEDDDQFNSTLQLMQFDSAESLQRFKLTNEYTPMHLIVQPPPPKTEAIFEDDDETQYKGWLRLFRGTDFSETEVRGIMQNYQNFQTMEIAFLQDMQALNSCYATIGGQVNLAWVSHRLSKTYKEQQ
jgi:hypothetical protein